MFSMAILQKLMRKTLTRILPSSFLFFISYPARKLIYADNTHFRKSRQLDFFSDRAQTWNIYWLAIFRFKKINSYFTVTVQPLNFLKPNLHQTSSGTIQSNDKNSENIVGSFYSVLRNTWILLPVLYLHEWQFRGGGKWCIDAISNQSSLFKPWESSLPTLHIKIFGNARWHNGFQTS